MSISAAQEAKALAAIEKLEDPARLRVMMSNAKSHDNETVATAAFRRLCEVQPENEPGSFEHDVWRSIAALEEMLREERGKTVRLSRTRQKITKYGELQTVADLTLRTQPSEGFHLLVERGCPELLFEAVVLRHSDKFEEQVIAAAKARLELIDNTSAPTDSAA